MPIPSATPGRAPRAASRKALLALALGTVLLTLLVAEFGLRVVAWLANRRETAALANLGHADVAPPPPGATVKLGQMLRASADARVIFEFIPNQQVIFQNANVTINADGYRGALVPRPRSPGDFRILGLGDSVMFGWGVGNDETYLARTAATLNAAYPATRWETVNTAVPGYNTAMEAAAFENRWRAWKPDVVIVHFIGNDLTLPNFLLAPRSPWSPGRSLLWEFAENVVRGRPRFADPFLEEAPHAENSAGFVGDPEQVPPEYRALVGWPAVLGGIRTLQNLAQTDGFRLVVFGSYRLPRQLRDLCDELKIPCFDAETRLDEEAARLHLADARHPPLTLSEQDPHPSVLGQQIHAEVLLDGLVHAGLLPGVTSPPAVTTVQPNAPTKN